MRLLGSLRLAVCPRAVVLAVAGRLARARDGAAALEFALAAPLFLALMLATLQIALVYLGQQGLESAAEAAASLIQSGQPQRQGWSAGQFHDAACAGLPPFLSCGALGVAVAGGGAVDTILAAPVSGYQPGGPGDVEVVRLSYAWPTRTAPLGFSLASRPGGATRTLIATVVVRNEAWQALP